MKLAKSDEDEEENLPRGALEDEHQEADGLLRHSREQMVEVEAHEGLRPNNGRTRCL